MAIIKNIPKIQKDWLFNRTRVTFFFIKQKMDVSGLFFNMIGEDYRWISYNGNGMSVLDSFWDDYTNPIYRTHVTTVIEYLYYIYYDAVLEEYYELANNMKICLDTLCSHLSHKRIFEDGHLHNCIKRN